MSDVCGRRRLVKLAFVTGASGNLRGFLEESKEDVPSSVSPISSFSMTPSEMDVASAPEDSFHSGFLQNFLAQGGQDDEKKIEEWESWQRRIQYMTCKHDEAWRLWAAERKKQAEDWEQAAAEEEREAARLAPAACDTPCQREARREALEQAE